MLAPPASDELILGPDCNGLRMTLEEFDAVEDYDEDYMYELVNGVVVVNPLPLAEKPGRMNCSVATCSPINSNTRKADHWTTRCRSNTCAPPQAGARPTG